MHQFIYFGAKENFMKIKFVQYFIDIIRGKKSLFKGTVPYLEYHVTDKCNLNCAGCSHFCPLVEDNNFPNLEQFKKDIKTLSKKVNIKTIRIMGGEPLLNPELSEFIKATRMAYPKADIRLATNGILLPTMNQEFWQVLRDNEIKIDFSKYPIVGDKFLQYMDLCDDNKIQIGFIHLSKKFKKFFNKTGKEDYKKVFYECTSKNCKNLWNSKIYQCPKCYTEYANKHFNMNMPVPVGVDIYKASGKEIEKILETPTIACAYCNLDAPEAEWSQSKKDPSEWFVE